MSRGKNYEKVWKIVKKCEKFWNDFALQLLPFSFTLNKVCNVTDVQSLPKLVAY